MGKSVIVINGFTVPMEESDRFLERWSQGAGVMAQQPGMVRARMHRALIDGAQPRFVNVAEWESREALDRALAVPEFGGSTQRMLDDPELHVTPHPLVYEVALEVEPESAS
jgi:heme-degrading monooxygenase HmoA